MGQIGPGKQKRVKVAPPKREEAAPKPKEAPRRELVPAGK